MSAPPEGSPAIPPAPAGFDAGAAPPRFRAYLEHYFFQGRYLDDAGMALLVSMDDAERRWFREVLDASLAIMDHEQRHGPTDLLRSILARDFAWVDRPTMGRWISAVHYLMR
jgi:hypothetical protein